MRCQRPMMHEPRLLDMTLAAPCLLAFLMLALGSSVALGEAPESDRELRLFLERITLGWRPESCDELSPLDEQLRTATPHIDLLLEVARVARTQDPAKLLSLRIPGVGECREGVPDPDHPGGLKLTGVVPAVRPSYLMLEVQYRLSLFVSPEIWNAAKEWAQDSTLPVECRIQALRIMRWHVEACYASLAWDATMRRIPGLRVVSKDPQWHLTDTDLLEAGGILRSLQGGRDGGSAGVLEGFRDTTVQASADSELQALLRWGDVAAAAAMVVPKADANPDRDDAILRAIGDKSRAPIDRLRLLDRLATNGEHGLVSLLAILDSDLSSGSLEEVQIPLPSGLGGASISVDPPLSVWGVERDSDRTWLSREVLRRLRRLLSARVFSAALSVLCNEVLPIGVRCAALDCVSSLYEIACDCGPQGLVTPVESSLWSYVCYNDFPGLPDAERRAAWSYLQSLAAAQEALVQPPAGSAESAFIMRVRSAVEFMSHHPPEGGW